MKKPVVPCRKAAIAGRDTNFGKSGGMIWVRVGTVSVLGY